jgi:chemotaxis-related protein WspD
VHCRNCPVYSGAGIRLLDRPLPADHLRQWTAYFAGAREERGRRSRTAFVFRIGSEWLALPPEIFLHVLEARPIHSLPHRRKGVILGVVNFRGELVVCVSLGALLGLDGPRAPNSAHSGRILVVASGGDRFAFPAEEVYGTHRYAPEEVQRVPATVSNALPNFTTGVLDGPGHTIGLLGMEAFFNAFTRSLS